MAKSGSHNSRFSNAIARRMKAKQSQPGKGGVIGNRVIFPGARLGGTSNHQSYPPGHGVNTPTPSSNGANATRVTAPRMPIAKNPSANSRFV